MKKLMIAAAAAAMIGGAQAITCVEKCEKDPCTGEKTCDVYAGTAHKVAISLKTTTVKGKVTKGPCDENCTYWRKQATKKINGLLWEQLGEDACTGCVPFGINSAFWTNDGAIDATFAIGVGLIDKGKLNKDDGTYDSKKAEAYGALEGAEFGNLAWAGFGTMAGTSAKVGKCGDVTDCSMYVKSISGGIAGQLIAPEWDEGICGDLCDAIVYGGCCDDLKLANTAAYGTIKITYDAATAKKVAVAADDQDIASFYKLPKAVDAEEIVINEVAIEE